MTKLKGYRTLVVNAASLVFTVLLLTGFDIDAKTQAAIVTAALGIVNALNLILRWDTDGPVPMKKPKEQ